MQGTGYGRRWLMPVALGALAALLIFTLAGGAAHAAEEAHVFDPVLSLTGSCEAASATKIDPVLDPGCPDAHPPIPFGTPKAVATDFYGNIFVSNGRTVEEGRIDVFDSSGVFITEVSEPTGAWSLAVDSDGNLYVVNAAREIHRFSPTVYEPEAGKIAYKAEPELVAGKSLSIFVGLAINPANDRLFAHHGTFIAEYGSAEEENKLLDSSIGEGTLFNAHGQGLAVDSVQERIYASDHRNSPDSYVIRIFELKAPHVLIGTVDGSETPQGKFGSYLSVAADEGTGNFFVYDGEAKVVHEFTQAGKYVTTIEHGFQFVSGSEIAVDNGPKSPNGALDEDGRYLYVPSHPNGLGHSFAFGPAPKEFPPKVEAVSFSEVSEDDADLSAIVNPGGLETGYVFEYTTEQKFQEEGGFAGAQVAAEGQIPAGGSNVEVSTSLVGLSPETGYRFRVVATNALGSAEQEGGFTTYSESEVSPPCANDLFRTGLSALLPDCRAYELVTPADTNARAPTAIGHLGAFFATRPASPAGDAVSFLTEGGTLPGSDGTGSWGGDRYLASRSQDGWISAPAGPTGSESPAPVPGGNSPDQGYFLWETSGEGSAVIDGQVTSYVRYPDGHSELVGRGSLGADPRATGKLISEDGGHIIFVSGSRVGASAVQLEPDAPPDGTKAIYDRTADEVTHVVSLLPGDLTPAAGQSASYVGASLDGEGVAFTIGSTLYLRHDNEETYEAAKEATFAGVAEGGGRIFYVKSGDLFAFDVASEEAVPFTESGDVTVVNVASLGTAAYFTSPTVLTEEENPNGATPQAGKENLYLSEEGAISFVSSVTERDVVGEPGEKELIPALGNWLRAVGPGTAELPGRFAFASSRATPDGTALLFESRADLDGYDPEGHVEIYRYDAVDGALECLSCNPTQAPATGEASLQSIRSVSTAPEPLSPFALVGNLRADGRRAFFQSEEALVAHDTDGLQDIYEWEAEGVGTCIKPGGCTYLISSGHSDRVDYLFAVSDSGDDVFIRSSDLLLGSDADETPSIYDARVVGGFPENSAQVCQGEGCKPDLWLPPPLPTPGMLPGGGSGKAPSRPCPKGKRKVKQAGKVRCVRKHRNHRRHKAGSQRRGTRK